MHQRYITIVSGRRRIVLSVGSILYVSKVNKSLEIHVQGDKIYKTRMVMSELEELLGEGFIKVHRGCLVSVKAIHEITDQIMLVNGESLFYTVRKKKDIIDEFREKQQGFIGRMTAQSIPMSEDDYLEYYKSFDDMPFAFADIEILFNDENRAIDWIFRYGNPQLAILEKMPVEKLIGRTFSSLFGKVASKWLKMYERSTLYGEKLEIQDYSHEVDAYLKIISFPTFKGHCGCILFRMEEVENIHGCDENTV